MSAYTTAERLLEYMELEADDPTTVRQLGALIERVSGLLDATMGLSFGGGPLTVTMTGGLDPYLWLPAPGASDVVSVIEQAHALVEGTDFVLDQAAGQYLLRLDALGAVRLWSDLSRSIVVTYAPSLAPASLEEVCLEECVRRWQGRAAGYPDVVGTGSEARRYTKAFAPGTLDVLASLSRTYGVRNTVAL